MSEASALRRRILVTGTSGFIGGHLMDSLAGAGHQVLGIDVVPPAPPVIGYAFIQCDIRDATALRSVLTKFRPDVVIHLAAVTDLIEPAQPDTYAANSDGVRNLLDAIAACDSVDRLVCTSSQLVCVPGYLPRHDNDFAPDTAYGESKVQTELICRQQEGGGVTWCIVRPTTIWGARMNARYLPFYRLLTRGLYFHVGSKPLLKSYGYVRNVVHQYIRLLTAPADMMHERVFYLADYEPIDLRKWADAFRVALQAPPIRSIPVWAASVLARGGDTIFSLGGSSVPLTSRRLRNILTEYRFDLRNTEQVCGPLPYKMADGVAETAAWLRTVLR
jgi:GlcNAc-P-P-Und epimerase